MPKEKLKILVVDDSTVHRKKIQMCLKEDRYDVSLCPSGEEAIEIFKANQFDLITLDLEMKGLTGIETCIEIRKLEDSLYSGTHCPIIFITSVDDLEIRIKCFEAGGDDFVEKVDIETLAHKVNAFLSPELIWEGFKILAVEDEKISQKFIKFMLSGRGAEVTICNDGNEAFELLKNNKDYDLVLTDQVMPNLSGLDLLKKVRTELGLANLPFILASGSSHQDIILNFYKAGGNDYTSKPFIKEEILAKVDSMLKMSLQNNVLRKHLGELENANRVKDQFLAICSHDLRTPLNTIIGLSDLLSEEVEESERITFSKKINKSASELLEMVNSLLDISEIHLKSAKVEHDRLDIVEIINESFHHLRAINEKKIVLKLNSQKEQIFITGNKIMLMRVFNNLLSNAYKFTHPKGEISITILKSQDKKIEVNIRDTGIGIPQEMMDKLFDQLSGIGRRGLEGERSVGLGMSIVKNILDEHGISISVKSEIGEGSCFTLVFEES
jgi:CheY-like chemotaxis protein/two-component sensor histidine kinase